jgi:hypothetical protein
MHEMNGMVNALPRRDDQHDAEWLATDEAPEAGRVAIGKRYIRERGLGDREHVLGSGKQPSDLAHILAYRPDQQGKLGSVERRER